MIRIIYSLLLTLLSPFFLYFLYRKKTGKPAFGPRWKEHFGITPALKTNQAPIWIHAVSVGEVIAATSIIKALKKQDPKQLILVTTTTSTGAEQAAKLGQLIEHRYMPVDFCFAVRRFLKTTTPTNMLIMETELWPNTLHTVAKFGIPITLINARLSEKSYLGYKKVQPIFNLLAKNLTQVCCQSQDDAHRFIALGISKSKVHITGSVKFELTISPAAIEAGKELREQIGEERLVWIAASTHKGEDEIALQTHRERLAQQPNALLILVPRHPERFNTVFELCLNEKFNTLRRSSQQSKQVPQDVQVYLSDTMGEMLTLIGAADICFMGGSLLGDKVGGHNVLEPVALKVPVITGPSYYNFNEIVNELKTLNAVQIVDDKNSLNDAISHLLPLETRQKLAGVYSTYIKSKRGSISQTLKYIK